MSFVAVPLTIAWLTFACYVIYKGLNDDTGQIQDNLDFYVALIAIIGGPALLFISSILEMWKSEQTTQMGVLPLRLELEIEQQRAENASRILKAESHQKHQQMIEEREQAHQHSKKPKTPKA
jgi:hypothetical protein